MPKDDPDSSIEQVGELLAQALKVVDLEPGDSAGIGRPAALRTALLVLDSLMGEVEHTAARRGAKQMLTALAASDCLSKDFRECLRPSSESLAQALVFEDNPHEDDTVFRAVLNTIGIRYEDL